MKSMKILESILILCIFSQQVFAANENELLRKSTPFTRLEDKNDHAAEVTPNGTIVIRAKYSPDTKGWLLFRSILYMATGLIIGAPVYWIGDDKLLDFRRKRRFPVINDNSIHKVIVEERLNESRIKRRLEKLQLKRHAMETRSF